MNLLEVMRALYASEINCSVSSFWDGGWDVRLGDEINGFNSCTSFDEDQFDAAAEWLDREARKHYPRSVYASKALTP